MRGLSPIVIKDLLQRAVAGPLIEVNESGCGANGPSLIQRQCDQLGLEFAIISHDIYCTGATHAPAPIDDQEQATRVAIDLGVVARGPASTSGVNWCVQFDTKAL